MYVRPVRVHLRLTPATQLLFNMCYVAIVVVCVCMCVCVCVVLCVYVCACVCLSVSLGYQVFRIEYAVFSIQYSGPTGALERVT